MIERVGETPFEGVEFAGLGGTDASTVAAALADAGLDAHYHNHDGEFVDVDGRPAIDRLLAAADGVGFELDLGWAGAAGADPLAVLRRHADRIDRVHLKGYDAAAGTTAPVDDGDLDVAAAIDAVRAADVDWLVYEAGTAPDSYGTLDHAADVVETYW